MAALSLGNNLTLSELVRREDPDGRLADIVDVLSETNEIIRYGTWIECNNGSYHEDTIVASQPTGNERAYDQGVSKEAGVTQKVTEPTCMLDGLSEVDYAKMQHAAGGPLAARNQEDGFFLAGMSKTYVSRIFDGNRALNPLRINGINNRSDYNTLSSDYTYDNADGNASATANKTSIYIIQFGDKMVNLIHPRNDPGANNQFGIAMDDYGKQIIVDSNDSTKKYPAYQTWFEIHFGIFIHDLRCIKRIVNISTSNIDGNDDFGFHEKYLIRAITDLEYGGKNAVMFCNRTIMAQIWERANDKGNASYTQDMEGEGPFARRVARFNGVPFARVDQITNTQPTVT